MNASNNFTVVGFICKDAEVRNFEKSSLARFGVPINITEERETILTSFNQAFVSLPHDDQPILPQGRQAKGGNTKDKRDLSKGWQRTTTSQEQATNFPKSEAKGRGASSPRNTSCLFKATQPL